MKKLTLLILSLFTLFAFAACSNTVADISTSSGGEIEVTESEVGTVEQTIETDEATVTEGAEVDAYTISYTDPEGYTVTEDGGGSVTMTLDGYEVGKIIYVPAVVEEQILDEYYAALEAEAEELNDYAAQYAADLDVDYQVEKQDVNGQEAILVTGTVTENSLEGNPGDVGYVLVLPVGEQLVILRGFADAETADMIRADMVTFAGNLQSVPEGASSMSTDASMDSSADTNASATVSSDVSASMV